MKLLTYSDILTHYILSEFLFSFIHVKTVTEDKHYSDSWSLILGIIFYHSLYSPYHHKNIHFQQKYPLLVHHLHTKAQEKVTLEVSDVVYINCPYLLQYYILIQYPILHWDVKEVQTWPHMHRTVQRKDIIYSVCNKKSGKSMSLHLSFHLTDNPFNKKKTFSEHK